MYKTIIVGIFTDENGNQQIDWSSEKILRVEDENGTVTETPNQDEELVKHLQGFAPAYNYLVEDYEQTLHKKVFDDMHPSTVVHFANKAGLFCAEDITDAVNKICDEGGLIIYDPVADSKGGNMYAKECQELITKIVEVEGWDALYRIIEHKDFMTHPTQPVLL